MEKKGEASKGRKSNKIKSVDKFLEKIKEITKVETGNFIYRGLTNTGYHLNSSATRRLETTINKKLKKGQKKKDIIIEDLSNYTKKLVQDAKQKGYHYKDGKELSDLELIADLQHHGCATMLMDFTKNALVALYFACKKDDKDGYVAVVDINNPIIFENVTTEMSKNNKIKTKEVDKKTKEEKEINKYSIEYYLDVTRKKLFFWEPPTLNNRIPSQHSIFVFGDTEIGKENFINIIIDKKMKESILKELDRIHDINPVTLFFDLAGYAQANSYEEAFTKFDWKDYYEIGLYFFIYNEMEIAIVNFQNALSLISNKMKDEKSKIYSILGLTKDYLGRYQEAINDYDRAIEIDQNDPGLYYNRGNSYKKLGHDKKAIENYNNSIRINPKYAEAFNNRGNSYMSLGNNDDALNDFNEAIRLNPKSANAYHNRGKLKLFLRLFEEAITDYDETIRLNPKDKETYNNRGNAKKNIGRNEEAIIDYNEALKLDSNFADAYYNRGIANANLNNHEEAIKDYNIAIRLNPKDGDYYNRRAFSKLYLGHREDAIKDFLETSRLFLEKERYDDAIANIKNLDILDNINPLIFLYRSIAYWNLGEKGKSKTDYDKAKELATQQDNKQVLKLLEECFNEDGSLNDNWKEAFKKQSDKSFD